MGKCVAKDLELVVNKARVLLDAQIKEVKEIWTEANQRLNEGDLKNASTEARNKYIESVYNKIYEIKNLERVKKTHEYWEPVMAHYYVVFVDDFMVTCGTGNSERKDWADESEMFIHRSSEGLTFENAYEPSKSYLDNRWDWVDASFFDSDKWHFKRLVWGDRYDSTEADFSDFYVTVKKAA